MPVSIYDKAQANSLFSSNPEVPSEAGRMITAAVKQTVWWMCKFWESSKRQQLD
jgi:hypothetical protein